MQSIKPKNNKGQEAKPRSFFGGTIIEVMSCSLAYVSLNGLIEMGELVNKSSQPLMADDIFIFIV